MFIYKRFFQLLIFSILLTYYTASCGNSDKEKKPIVIDFHNEKKQYDPDLKHAVGHQKLINAETKGMTDLRTYFDTLTYKKGRYFVLSVTKDDYEIIIKPTGGYTEGPLFLFTKNHVYTLNREELIIKNTDGFRSTRQ